MGYLEIKRKEIYQDLLDLGLVEITTKRQRDNGAMVFVDKINKKIYSYHSRSGYVRKLNIAK